MLASNAAKSEKWCEYAKKTSANELKIAKIVENNHLGLEMSENYKDRYCIFFWVPEHPHQGGFAPLDPSKRAAAPWPR